MSDDQGSFKVLAAKSLGELAVVIEGAGRARGSQSDDLAAMTVPVTHLKANASTARCTLIVELCNMLLPFLDDVGEADAQVIEIAQAYLRVFDALVGDEMPDDGGQYGEDIKRELRGAGERYFAQKDA